MTNDSAFWENEEIVAVVDPALDEIDERLAGENEAHPDSVEFRHYQSSKSRSSQASDLLNRLLMILLPPNIGPKCQVAIGNKALALSWMVQAQHPDINGVSMAALAEKTQQSRALFSHYVRSFEETLGVHVRAQKRAAAPAAYAKAQEGAWRRREARAITAANFAKKRIGLIADELVHAIAEQPTRVVGKILSDWSEAVLRDIDNVRLKTPHDLTKSLKKVVPMERPAQISTTEENLTGGWCHASQHTRRKN
jgi:hypothetical protein